MSNGKWAPLVRLVALSVLGVLGACRNPASPPAPIVWDEWPWMTTSISSGRVSVTGTIGSGMGAVGSVRLSARFVNAGADSAEVSHGACSFGVRLRIINNRALMPVAWDNRPAGAVCILPWYTVVVPGNGAREVVVSDVSPTALRDIVPAGEYNAYVTWRTTSTGPVHEAHAGTITVPAR